VSIDFSTVDDWTPVVVAAATSIALTEFPRQLAQSAFFGQAMWLPDKKRALRSAR
jgi:hypothetical protein